MSNYRWISAILVVLGGAVCGNSASPTAAATATKGAARPELHFTIDVLDNEAGLPQSSVLAMLQSRDGYLWLGTLNGLVRFDGSRFTVFDEFNTPGLPSSRIVSLFEDRRGNLWVGTEHAGVALIQAGQITRLDLGQGSRESRLAATCEDATGALWLYAQDGQLWRYRDGSTTRFAFETGRPSLYRTVIAENSGQLWVATQREAAALNPTAEFHPPELPLTITNKATRLDLLLASREGGYWRLADGRIQKWRSDQIERELGTYTNLWDPYLTPIRAACEDRQGNLLVGTLGAGLFWFDDQGQVTALTTNQGLSHNSILSLCMDHEGTLWVGTDGGGLNRVKRQVFDVLPATKGMVIQSVCADPQSGLWFGSNRGEVGFAQTNEVRRFDPRQFNNYSVRSVLADGAKSVWVGAWATYGSGLYRLWNNRFRRVAFPGKTIPSVVQALHVDRQGRLWVGTRNGLGRWEGQNWRLYTTDDGLSSEVIRALADDAAGNLWIGTEGGGLDRFKDGEFTAFRLQDGLPSDKISCLWVDKQDVLWVGTVGSGLARFDGQRWARFSTRDGLVSNSLGYLIEDDQGYLWIGSNAGLMRIPKQALNDFVESQTGVIPCRVYGKRDGLPTSECTQGSQPAASQDGTGRLWFATTKGLASVDPTQIRLNTNPPPVMIESVYIDGQIQNPNRFRIGQMETITVPAGRERLEIHYTSLNLGAPDLARFRYRMTGHETDWTEAGNSRIARYSKLPPGQYQFHVIASNEDQVWNEIGSTLTVLVLPPFWRTWWFLSLTAAGLLMLVVAIVHYLSTQRLQRQVQHLKQEEALEKERSRIARDMHDQLGANLTQVGFLGEMLESDKDVPEEVEAHARQITQTARETTRALDEIVWAVNPANDTLDGLVTYVCKYAQEYLGVAGLRYRLDVPEALPETPLPPDVRHNVFLAAKESITNIVRHAQASAAWLRLRREGHRYVLEIEDNGRGLADLDETKARTRNGLSNMRKRMEEIGGQFDLGPGEHGGARVRLTLPL